MNKKNFMGMFINEINDKKLMTNFIRNIFRYKNFYDYNYLFRMIENDDEIIIDIYDNVTDNRFNRYIFSFSDINYSYKVIEEKNVFVNYLSILKSFDGDNNLIKLAYLFKIEDEIMIEYASTFLDKEFVDILKNILKKPIWL